MLQAEMEEVPTHVRKQHVDLIEVLLTLKEQDQTAIHVLLLQDLEEIRDPLQQDLLRQGREILQLPDQKADPQPDQRVGQQADPQPDHQIHPTVEVVQLEVQVVRGQAEVRLDQAVEEEAEAEIKFQICTFYLKNYEKNYVPAHGLILYGNCYRARYHRRLKVFNRSHYRYSPV